MHNLSPQASQVAIKASSLCQQAKALEIADQLSLPLSMHDNESYSLLLIVTPQGLALQAKAIAAQPLQVDFLSGKNAWRQKALGSELLAKAVGCKGSYKPLVLDLSAGLGRDAFVLANLGCRVEMLERSPILALLLEDGLQRLKASGYQGHLSLIQQQAFQYLTGLSAKPDVIYFDPMYPHRSKTALVKKDMRILRALVGDDQDASQVAAMALRYAAKRLVIKRPRLAEVLLAKPDIVFAGKTSRFDIYLAKG